MKFPIAFALAALTGLTAFAAPASATTINWVQWSTSYTAGQTTGSASGTISTSPSVNLTYTGEVQSVFPLGNYPSWGPSPTFDAGGLNAPPSTGGIVQLIGGPNTLTDTITFSAPVTNPYIAIWSLGQTGVNASFNFNATPVLDSGGGSNEYGGSTISVVGNNVYGIEGNGVVQFNGTFTSISWTNPVYENWYGFTVGIANVASNEVPEPLTLSLFGAGLIGAASLRRRRKTAAK